VTDLDFKEAGSSEADPAEADFSLGYYKRMICAEFVVAGIR
jgi:hypothetical protein